jgi:glycosyltransferase involved in cell wall biosynthesis
LIGSAPASHSAYAEGLRRQAAELDLPHPIIFVGDRPDVERWYAAMDVQVISSRAEGVPTTALEGQSCGVPVVATRVAAVHEGVEDGVTGLLVAPHDPDALAAAVVSLLGDPARRVEMGRAGRAAAVGRFGAERSADVHAEAYEAALTHAAARSLP